MTGTLAQLVSLMSYGNQCLSSGQFPVGYYPLNSVFKFCNGVDFRDIRDGKETVLVIDPNHWFGYLKLEGCRRVRLFYQPSKGSGLAKDYQLAGMVGGGGTWMIETIFNDYSDFWSNRWQVTQKDDSNNKIWSVNYGRTHVNLPTMDLQFDLQETATSLRSALDAIIEFAGQKDLSDWADVFKKALSRLDSDSPAGEAYQVGLVWAIE